MNYEQLKTDYERDGYLVIEDFVPHELLARLSRVTGNYIKEAKSGSTADNPLIDVIFSNGDNKPELRRIIDPERVAPVYDEIMRLPPLIELVSVLVGGAVRFDHAKLNNKPPSGGGKILWHQDYAFYPQTNDDMLAVGVMIEDCTELNGTMLVIPGSHKFPVFDHHQDGEFVGGIDQKKLNGYIDNPVMLTGRAGSITVHHARLLHCSSTNKTDKDRPFLVLNYFAADAFPVFFGYDWQEFNSRLLLGDIVHTPRYTPVECKVPLPAPQTSGEYDRYISGSIYDLQDRIVN